MSGAPNETVARGGATAKSMKSRTGVPSGATATKAKLLPGKTGRLSAIDSGTTISTKGFPFMRRGTKNGRIKNNENCGTKKQIIHKLGTLPTYLKHKANKNLSLLTKAKREIDVEVNRLFDAQARIVSLQGVYHNLQIECSDGKDVKLDKLTLLAFKNNSHGNFRILSKLNLQQENAERLKDGFNDAAMLLKLEKLMSFLNIQKYEDILLEISDILDSVKFGPSGDCISEKITTVRTKLVIIHSNLDNEKIQTRTEYSHIIDGIRDLIRKQNLELESLQKKVETSQNEQHDVAKLNEEIGRLSQQLVLKTLESDVKEETVTKLREDYMNLKEKMESRSNDVEFLSRLNKKTEAEKNKKIEELQLLLEQATAEELTRRALPLRTEEYEELEKDTLEKEMIVKSLQSTIAEMQGKLDQLNLAEKNSVSPVNNAAAASAEELHNLCLTLGCLNIEVSHQRRVIEDLEAYKKQTEQQGLQQAQKIARLISENVKMKIEMSALRSAETVSLPTVSSWFNTSCGSVEENLFKTSGIDLMGNERDEEHATSEGENIEDESNSNNDEDCNYDSDSACLACVEELSPTARLSQKDRTVKVRKYVH